MVREWMTTFVAMTMEQIDDIRCYDQRGYNVTFAKADDTTVVARVDDAVRIGLLESGLVSNCFILCKFVYRHECK